MAKRLMESKFSRPRERVYRIECECGSPPHDCSVSFLPLSEQPDGYEYTYCDLYPFIMEITMPSDDETHGLWRRLQDAWGLVFHKDYTRYAHILMGPMQIAAFTEALAQVQQDWRDAKLADAKKPQVEKTQVSFNDLVRAASFLNEQKAEHIKLIDDRVAEIRLNGHLDETLGVVPQESRTAVCNELTEITYKIAGA